jgi:hypothetical protein
MTTKISYVISEAHPDYKRPYLYNDFGIIDVNLIDTFFVEKVSEFIFDRTDIDDITSVDDITSFWENYYDEYYMDNSPWDARIFMNGEWKNVCPSNVEIFECLNRMKTAEKNEEDKEENEENEEESEEEGLLDWEFTDEEQEIHEKMKAYVENELEKSDLETMSKMNQNEQIIYVLSKCMLNISSDKYKENRELFYKFLNIILRITERDIAVTTEEMEKNHDEKLSLKLSYLMNVYGSLLEYKTIFNSYSIY